MHQHGHRLYAPLLRVPLVFQISPGGECRHMTLHPDSQLVPPEHRRMCPLFGRESGGAAP